ncbi:SPOR domain-containing protein [Noviherbaspirillum cavernae]|uniref:SPOR domain-containing protein n=1 Tax=Noviherbaspirillum cavernae TaxID=2320862 RepID=A0A418X1V5_9BURK|nr:SPOR domain-containing protein [Noviherbaspirillum cavernae]RJG06411.1 SPOR domain-containing protein [Noviherbaspirillum cavernae]
MSLFSFLRKNKQESAPGDTSFHSPADRDSNTRRSRSKRKQGSQSDDKHDPVLPEKKRARRRLIGAIALVLAAIIGLPMILDSEPKPLADDIAIRIPSKDKPAQTSVAHQPAVPAASNIPTSKSLDPSEEVIEPSAAPANAKSAQPATVNPAIAVAPSAADKPKDAGKAPQAQAAKATATEKPTTPDSVTKTESKAAPKVEKADDSARAMALLEGKTDPKAAADKKASKYVIQIAALASKEKVNELQTRLKDAGIKSYTQKIATESGERIRIRVGPFVNKDEADKVKARIGKLGLNGTLVPA